MLPWNETLQSMFLKDALSFIYRHQIKNRTNPLLVYRSSFTFCCLGQSPYYHMQQLWKATVVLPVLWVFERISEMTLLDIPSSLAIVRYFIFLTIFTLFLQKHIPWFQVMNECKNSIQNFTLCIEKIGPRQKKIFAF